MSLRVRLTLLTTAVLVLALAVSTALTVQRTEASLRARGDQELAALASGLMVFAQNQVRRDEAGQRPLQYRALEDLQLPDALEGFAVAVRSDGKTLPLPRLTREPSEPLVLPEDLGERVGGPSFTVRATNGVSYIARALAIPGTDALLVVALTEASLRSTTRDLVRAHVMAGVVVVVAAMAATALAVRVGLRPLGELTAAATRIAADPTDPLLPPGPPGTELGQLSSALTTMVDALDHARADADDAKARTERFAADAAHELRTPVTAISGYVDLYRQGAVANEHRLDEVFDRIGHEARRLRSLVEDLLVLDLIDQGGESDRWGSCELVTVAAAAAADSMTVDPNRVVVLDAPSHAWVGLDADRAFRIVANLLANVRAHTPEGGTAHVLIHVDEPDTVTVTVDDNGPGIPADMRERVFDRFVRIDADRARTDDSGSGLGLAIVASLARGCGGTADAAQAPGGGARIVVTLPKRAPVTTPRGSP